jgi:hypothetical protein
MGTPKVRHPNDVAGERVDRVRLDRCRVLVTARHFLGRQVLGYRDRKWGKGRWRNLGGWIRSELDEHRKLPSGWEFSLLRACKLVCYTQDTADTTHQV